jgi:hypothetical protein
MAAALHLKDNAPLLKRLSTLYVFVFFLTTASLYLSLVRSDYDREAALAAASAGAIACVLLRWLERVPATAEPTVRSRSVFSEADLVRQLDTLRREARSLQGSVGVMLVSAHNLQDDEDRPPPAAVMNLVRGQLFRDADSRVYQLDERTFAVAERREEVVLHFDRISMELQREFRARRANSTEFEAARLTVGVAVAEHKTSAKELLQNARSATRMAEAHGRDTFFRRI